MDGCLEPPLRAHRGSASSLEATEAAVELVLRELDELGPFEYIVVEFPADEADFSGAMAAELSALGKNGAVRVLDLLILKKEPDGSVEAFEAHDVGDSDLGELLELVTELAMLLAADDVEAIGAALDPAGASRRADTGERLGRPVRLGDPTLGWAVGRAAEFRSRRSRPR